MENKCAIKKDVTEVIPLHNSFSFHGVFYPLLQ